MNNASRVHPVDHRTSVAPCAAAAIAQMLKLGLFVFKPLGAKDVGLRIVFFGDGAAVDGEQIKRGQVLAFDEAVQIARREDES